jgi:hypothetical protein
MSDVAGRHSADDEVRRALDRRNAESIEDVEERAVVDGVRDADFLRRFEDEADPNGRRRRLVLLGAGASCDAGLPTAADLDAILRAEPQLVIYRSASDIVGHDVEQAVQLLEVMAGDGPDSLGAKLGSAGMWDRLERLAGIAIGSGSAVAMNELTVIRDCIRRTFWLSDDARCAYLEPMVKAQVGGTIATLNYDNTLDLAPGGLVALGSGGPEDVVNGVVGIHPWRVEALALHGYLGWEERRDRSHDITVVVNRGDRQDPSNLDYPYQPAIIFGSGNKLRHFGPFLGLLQGFASAVWSARTIITIGYSWRDPHINAVLRQWCSADFTLGSGMNDGERHLARQKLVVGTGPHSGALPVAPDLIRTHFSDRVEVRPVRGTATTVIAELFGDNGEFSQPHYGSYRRFYCGS